MARKFLRGAAYALGEAQRSYSDIPEFEKAAAAAGLPNLPSVMGFGSYFATRDVYGCASASVGQSIASSGVAPEAVDVVVFCSSAFKERTFSERNLRIGELLRRWNVAPRRIVGVSGAGCTDLLSALDLACALLDRGDAHTILIVAVEAFEPKHDRERVMSHALISDAAASLVLSDRRAPGAASPDFEIVAREIASDVAEIGGGMSITPSSPNRNFIRNALKTADSAQTSVRKVFGNNVYLPIKSGREGIVGFANSQLYLDNVARTGHCLGCDSIINLVDFGPVEGGDLFVLYAEAEGHRGCIALRSEP